MKAEILPTDTPALFDEAVNRATELLRAGEVVALPTETVYGLAANACNAQAVERIFEIKGRPSHNPIIVHVAGIDMARACVAAWPKIAESLARSFWPGPLTLVLERSGAIPDIVTAGGATVGVRWPSHPFIQAVIRRCGFPLAAPSANPSNELSPTNASHVQKKLGSQLPLIVDGGQCQVGIESTVLDLTTQPPRVLRPGMIHDSALLSVLGELASGNDPASLRILKSPGNLPRHYSPKAKLVIWNWENETELAARVAQLDCPAGRVHVVAHTRIPSRGGFARVSVIPHDAEAFARAIYAELHESDEFGAAMIIVESPPATNEWRAVQDRLKRAAAD
jgi:L-threonylcarbamoyladenylate synthase